ncbi:MAG: alpha/beta hydrolase [Acidimicrobiaceae bacterium]|nr:alpha/beta hydrolase [Acidimicrobiaceae bacterium]
MGSGARTVPGRVRWCAVMAAVLVASSCGSGSSEPDGAPSAASEPAASEAPAPDDGSPDDGPVPADDPPVVETVPPTGDREAGGADDGSAGSVDAAGADGAGGAGEVVFEPPIVGVDCPSGVPFARGARCALATVPIDRGDPGRGTTEISLLVWPGVAEARAGDAGPPLAVLQGGPGGPSSDLVEYYPRQPYTQVFIDQRGTGFGTADFDCPEIEASLPEILPATRDEARSIELAAYGACFGRLAGDPLLAHTDTAAHAADVVDVMEALGFDRWSVYGVSYGTTIALEILRHAPAGLDGAVLDGVYPPELEATASLAFSAQRVLDEVDSACAADAGCSILVESFSDTLEGLIAELNEEPLTVSLGSFDSSLGEAVDVLLDGDSLAGLVFQFLYLAELTQSLPLVLYGLGEGMTESAEYLAVLAVEYSLLIYEAEHEATYFAANCADSVPFDSAPPEGMGVFAAAVVGEGIEHLCDLIDVPASPPAAAEAVSSDKPVLMLSGRFDPITPPEFAAQAAQHLPNATLVVRDGAHHGVWVGDDCINDIVGDFLTDPDQVPDTSCADEPRPIAWALG